MEVIILYFLCETLQLLPPGFLHLQELDLCGNFHANPYSCRHLASVVLAPTKPHFLNRLQDTSRSVVQTQ
jgi:hypothetical protein